MPTSKKLISGPINHLSLCRYGMMLYNTHDVYIGRSLDLYGEFSENEIVLFRQLVRPGDVVVDAGANIGTHTLYFSQAVGRQGRVLAFEPQRFVFQTLCANMAINSLTNVFCHQFALGSAPGQVLVPPIDYSQENNYGGLGLGEFTKGEPVEVRTLDGFALPRCRLLKIDVEGMERQVIEGARDTIARLRPLLHVENDRPQQAPELLRLIDGLGYAMYQHHPPLFNPDNFNKNAENVFGPMVSANLLCVPHEAKIALEGFRKVAPT